MRPGKARVAIRNAKSGPVVQFATRFRFIPTGLDPVPERRPVSSRVSARLPLPEALGKRLTDQANAKPSGRAASPGTKE